MLLTIQNLSASPIVLHGYPKGSKLDARTMRTLAAPIDEFHLLPEAKRTTSLPKRSGCGIFIKHGLGKPDSYCTTKEWRIDSESFRIDLSLALGASWQVVHVPKECPWVIFKSRVTRKHHKLLILNRRNLESFLSELPDRLPLSSVLLPGTHDTMAFYGWPISQCQSPSTLLSTQLHSGIRVLDIRLAVIPPPLPGQRFPSDNQQLIAYHGLWPQRTSFLSILFDIETFLTSSAGRKETIVMSLKQEDFAVTPSSLFSQLVHKTIVHGPGGWSSHPKEGSGPGSVNRGMWFLENRIPTLGEVRGKVVMFSRFGGSGEGWDAGLEGLGIHPTTWPDSEKEGFEWEVKGTRVRTHDWYGIPSFFSIPEKLRLATTNMIPPENTDKPFLPVTYFSAASFPFAFPPTIAKGLGWPKLGLGIEGVNSLLGKWLIDKLGGAPDPEISQFTANGDETQTTEEEPRIRGWTFLDYYSQPEDSALIPLLVECNFRGRMVGEEGW